jgi:cytochrome d ubiquinol oxidase subunit II
MIDANQWLPLVFAAVTTLSILAYVLMDGWDLGVGILYPLVARRADRQVLFDSIAPFWDANETWLVFGGMMLLVGFPLAYATLLPMLYLPAFVMLFALVLRGVSYEFRQHGGALQAMWEWIFAGGSLLAALAQGWMLGIIVEGLGPETADAPRSFAQAVFPLICGVGLVGGYALLGACWLILKTCGALQTLGREVGHSALLLTALLLIVISVWTPLVSPHVAQRWFTPSHLSVLWIFPVATALVGWKLWSSFWKTPDGHPLLWATLLFVLAFAGFAISVYPYIVPYRYTLFEAANDPSTLRFAGVGVLLILPITTIYLLLGYRVFRGKVDERPSASGTNPHIGSRCTSGNPVDLHMS